MLQLILAFQEKGQQALDAGANLSDVLGLLCVTGLPIDIRTSISPRIRSKYSLSKSSRISAARRPR